MTYVVTSPTTNQVGDYVTDEIHRLQSEPDVLPMGVYRYAGLRVGPRQEVVETAVEYGICWLRGGRAGGDAII